jgi:mortality factor 4-like protein 1
LKKGKETDAARQRTIPKTTAAPKKKVAGSELSSAQGSEERHSSLPATGRGQKRGRDLEIEKVREFSICMI